MINMRHAVFRRGAFQAHKVSISITEGEFQSLDLSGEFHCNSQCELLACLFDSNSDRNSHTNHGIVTGSDKSHHLYVKLSYEEAFPINILGDEHIIQMYSCTHYRSNYIKSQASSNNFESSFYQV